MQRQVWIVAVIIVAMLALTGIIVALVTSGNNEGVQTTATAETTTPAPEEKAPIKYKEEAPSDIPATTPEFSFHRLEVDTSKDAGEACFVFTARLDDTGKIIYDDYIKLEPEAKVEVRAQGNRLCLTGLEFGVDYTATLRAGLRDGAGDPMGEEEVVPVSLRDRPPFVGFGEGFILPTASTEGLPLTTVNVDKVEIEVLRVSDRLISQLRESLVDEKEIYGYDRQEISSEQGRSVWKGTMDVTGEKNAQTVTLFPLSEALKTRENGVYLVVARDAAAREEVGDEYYEDYAPRAAQWVIATDLGLTTYKGADGLHVFVRSLATAEALGGVELALVARDNSELGRVVTDRQGQATFPADLLRGTGGAEPVLVTAYGKGGDFAYLDLRRPAFDLTDRGVEGRGAPGPVDAYLYSERGIYRPGETVHLMTLLRDRNANAIASAPVTLVVTRPDGVEYRRFQAKDLAAGGAVFDVPLSDTAQHGAWTFAAYIDVDQPPLGEINVDVQDFVPERLKVTLTPDMTPLKPGDEFSVPVEARYLYGAPASDLSGEAQLRLTRAEAPFPKFKDYSFGLSDETFSPEAVDLAMDDTNAEGKTKVLGAIDDATASSAPLEAALTVSIEEPGGRLTSEETTLPVLTGEVYLGLKPKFDSGEVAENADAGFEVVAVDASGQQIEKKGLRYEIIREDTQYQWYQVDGEWRYDTVTRDKLIDTGTLDTKATAPVELTGRVGWGPYRFIVRDPETGAATSYHFYAGWGASASEDRPDRITVTADKEKYQAGDRAVISLKPPVAGKALVVIASDRVHLTRLIDVPAEGADVTFTVDASWGTGAYAMATLYHPLKDNDGGERVPARAIGLAWLNIDTADRQLALTIDAPDVVRPRTGIDVPVKVANAKPGEKINVVLAAVDEGILQLTDFKSPAPYDYFFGKRRLGVDIRDDYGRLIAAEDGPVGPIREGGDSFGGRGLTTVPTRTIALFSGVLSADRNGEVVAHLDIPDFAGELRLMATAFSPNRVGEADKAMAVRDPVVAELTLPRFLAPGDSAEATLLLDNVEGAAGTYKVTLDASGTVKAGEGASVSADLEPGAKTVSTLPIEALTPGIATISLKAEGPGGFSVTRAWPIEVRPAALPDFIETAQLIKPGESATLKSDLLADFFPATAALTVAVTPHKGFDVPGLLKWLDRYPYGCLEQTTSRAFPLLFANDLAEGAGLAADKPIDVRIQDAIERVVDMQNYSGGFGMWGPRDDYGTDGWLVVFAMDFLTQAKEKGYVVPNAAIKRGFSYLRQIAGRDSQADANKAYALYVLARNGAVPVGDVRYFYDTEHGQFSDAVAPAFSAAALAALGDKARAREGFADARMRALEADTASYVAQPYGSLLRDVAAVTAVTAASGDTEQLPALMDKVATLEPPLDATTTQEKAWLVQAASALETLSGKMDVEATNAKLVADGRVLDASPAMLDQGITLTNRGENAVWYSATASGIPTATAPATADGVTIEKRYYTLDGAPADLATVKQSDRIIVSISGKTLQNIYRNMAVMDLLPAGFEIEAVLEPGENNASPYPFLGRLTRLDRSEMRDDRFVAAFDLGDRYRRADGSRDALQPPYEVAYVVRAVTPGKFTVPAAKIEDMYHPEVHARTAAANLTVTNE